MNADLEKIKNARIFKKIPERAFERIVSLIKVRSFQSGEEFLIFRKTQEFEKYFGYVVQGRVLFLGANEKPLGIAMKDEFFIGRSFSISDINVESLVSAADATLVIFIPKDVISALSQASDHFAEILEEIYESIFERAKFIAQDSSAPKTVHEWLQSQDHSKTISSWVGAMEQKRLQAIQKRKAQALQGTKVALVWIFGAVLALGLGYESLTRLYYQSSAFIESLFPYFAFEKFEPGSRWNIFLGILGYSFISLTALHIGTKWAIRKLHWKINFQLSQQLHIFFGVIGSYCIVLHTSFLWTGENIAFWAYYCVMLGLFTGFVGQFISSQIPTTIRGEKLKLDALKSEQRKLQQKAQLLMTDEGVHKTSIMMISQGVPKSLWGNIFLAPFMWLREKKVKSSLTTLGLGERSAAVAAELIHQEFKMMQKIRFLEGANIALKRWMLIHKPIGYAVYILGALHIILVSWLA